MIIISQFQFNCVSASSINFFTLSSVKINYFQLIRKEELDVLTEYTKEATCAQCVVYISGKDSIINANMTSKMVLRKRYQNDEFEERWFKTVIQESMELAVKPNLGNPQIIGHHFQGMKKCKKVVAKVFDAFLGKIIDEYFQSNDENGTKDFVDVMLGYEGSKETERMIEREQTKATILVSTN